MPTRRPASAHTLAALALLSGCAAVATPADGASTDPARDATAEPAYVEPALALALQRMCVLNESCGTPFVFGSALSLGACAYSMQGWLSNPLAEPSTGVRFECAFRSTDCASFRRCVSRGHDAAFCMGRPMVCDGDVQVRCSGDQVVAIDCAANGLRCSMESGYGVCTNGVACVVGESSCRGTVQSTCQPPAAVEAPVDCARLSVPSRCLVGADGFAQCVPPAVPCTGEEPFCDGTRAVYCDPQTRTRTEENCALRSGRCVNDRGTVSCGEATLSLECRIHDFPDRCEGDAIVTCLGGRHERFDCRSAGLRTCARSAAGDGGSRASCVP